MSQFDAVKKSLANFIQGVMRPVDYFALYEAKVVQQANDGSLQVQPTDKRLSGMQKVPLRLGIPNTTAKVQPGARGLVGFENGDPQKPFWGPWGTSTLTELNIGAGTDFVALAQKVLDELDKLHTHFTAVETVITGAPIPEPGNGSPSAFQTALSIAIGTSSYPSPSSVAATLVKVK